MHHLELSFQAETLAVSGNISLETVASSTIMHHYEISYTKHHSRSTNDKSVYYLDCSATYLSRPAVHLHKATTESASA